MSDPSSTNQPDKNTSRTRRYVLATIAFLVLALTATQYFLHQPSIGSPKFLSRTYQLWVATVLVVLALLILATVLGRNLIKLYFERKSGQVGSRFRTKMVSIFVVLSLLPAVLLFSLAYWLVKGPIEQWLSTPATLLQDDSRAIAQQYYEETTQRAREFAVNVAARVGMNDSMQPPLPAELVQALSELRRLCRIDSIRIYGKGGALAGESGVRVSLRDQETALARLVSGALHGQSSFEVQASPPKDAQKDMIWATAPIRNRDGEIIGAVVTETMIPGIAQVNAKSVMEAYQSVTDAYEKYGQLQREKAAVQFTTLLIFALSTLLIVFAFSWFAMYLAKRITVPIQALAEGAAAVTAGNLDYRVQCAAFDELEDLVASFNRMTAELQENKINIEAAQNSLRETNVKLDDRRRFIETIVQAIPTGVLVLNSSQGIRTMNRAAEQMLEVQGQNDDLRLEDVVKGPARDTLRMLLRKSSVLGPVVRDLDLNLEGKTLHLAATVTPLVDSSEQRTGWVIVLDDLTELLSAEKMAAWQEVARRLAHEIKNPLTPIQLSAERMLHRFRQIPLPGRAAQREVWRDQLAAYDNLLEECVQTIIKEADSLKTLVDEFSGFARLPGVRLEETDLHRILENALSLYNGRIQDVQIERIFDAGLPLVRLDAEQMKRVFINLFDNALEAMAGNNARTKILRIRTSRNTQQHSVRIEISDTGRGFPKEYQDSLFLPYFSTRRGGTGLGLAIVRQVVSDHHGQVRAEPNSPLGTKIVIDLPLAPS
ncbi:MAG: HAMP domain-containing protein [Acidobacteriia bacterium]|nr:HAMP domain-containing protein [Terriglobia bacterium]